MLAAGAVIAGKYRVERELGAGGMGYVVAAIHEQLDQRVAVKLLASELCENSDAVLRFLREARAAVRIQSEHVARVLDVGELENGAPYMVMEFLSGQDLSHELQEQKRLDVHTTIDYVLQACEAVAEAHSLGVVHRDLKPANLFLTRRPDGSPLVKVLDFGIAKALAPEGAAESAPNLTAPHALLGSPAYMSPEQVRRPNTVDIRTDIWSLGSILYEFLVGEPPFRGDTPLAMLAAVVSDPMPSIRDRRPDVSQDLESVIARCLEKNADNRYQTVAALAQALGPHAHSASLPSIARISGILRSSLSVSGPNSTTMRSVTTTGADRLSDTEAMPLKIVATAASGDKQTQSDWGASQSIIRRGKRRVIVAVASGVATVFLFLWLLFRPSANGGAVPEQTSRGPEPTAAATSEPGAIAPLVAASARQTAMAPPTVLPALDAGARARKATAETAQLKSKRPVVVPHAATSAQAAPQPPPAHAAAGDDPLEGRR
jgi:eukaryotic-like serine/threonine-protein kinase